MEESGTRERTSQPSKPPSKFNVYQNPQFVAVLTANSFRPSKSAIIFVIVSSFASLIALHRMISWEEGFMHNVRVRSYSPEFARFLAKAMEILISLVFVGTLLSFIKITFLWMHKVGSVSGLSAKGVNARTSLTSHQLALLGIQTKFGKPSPESPNGPLGSKSSLKFLATDTLVPLHQPLTSPTSSSPAKSSTSFCTPTSQYYAPAASQSPPFQSSTGSDSVVSSILWSNKRGSATKEIITEEDLNMFLEDADEKIIGSAGRIGTPPPTVNGPVSPTMLGTTRSTTLRPVRMSPNAQKLTTSPRKVEGEIPSPMSMKDIDEAFEQLGIYSQIEQWRDSLRQWFSSVLLNPLVKKIETSHVQVMQSAAKLGISITISQVGCDAQADKTPVNVSSRTKEWLPTFSLDEDGMLHQLRAILVQNLGASFSRITTPSLQISSQQSSLIPLVQECVDAITEHQRLHSLMKGDWAKGLLPQGNIHADYTVRRIRELAEGTCVKNFEYFGDGDVYDKVNRRCTSELPSDSHLLIYLFCAFLEHPKWMLHVDPNSNTGSQSSNNSLFLGVLPPKERFPEKSIAIISGAPSVIHHGASIMAVGRKSPPVFALYWDKKIQFSFQGRSALWDSILLLCHRIKTGYGGVIQGVHMASPAFNLLQILDSPTSSS